MSTYDRIGRTYASTRRPDPRIDAQITAALGAARRVVNVGAGTGSYEPADRDVTAVEPSAVMRAQRPEGSAFCVDASAEALPFADGAFDAAMALLTVHHWPGARAGIAELDRVTRAGGPIVVLHWDQDVAERLWLVADYLPHVVAFDRARGVPLPELERWLGDRREVQVHPVPVPADCSDGFLAAYWARPAAYLDPGVRAGMSLLSGRDEDPATVAGLARLEAELDDGTWRRRYGRLLEHDTFDGGYRLVVAR